MPGTRIANEADDGKTLYRCQATEIPKATEQLRFLQVDQYIRGLRSWKLGKFLRGLPIELFNLWQAFSLRRLPARLRIAGGSRYPFVIGKLEKGETPSAKLDLRPGDYVRIKSKEEIVATLDDTNCNRGLLFDGEMASYCGRTARVQGRVNRLIEESHGRDDRDQVRLHHPRGRGLRGGLLPVLHACDLLLLARDLAREDRCPRGQSGDSPLRRDPLEPGVSTASAPHATADTPAVDIAVPTYGPWQFLAKWVEPAGPRDLERSRPRRCTTP